MEEIELIVGGVYRAKRPLCVMNGFDRVVNDRQIMHIGNDTVQYDSPSVARGRHYPSVSKEAFLKWSARRLSDEEAGDDWIGWKSERGANK